MPRISALAALVVMVTSFGASAQGQGIDPDARGLLQAAAEQIGQAKTIRLTAKHKLDASLGMGERLAKGPIEITVQRPNRFHAEQSAGQDTRVIAFDGQSVSLMYPILELHALEKVKAASISEFADRVDERFGFRPPIAELLSDDLASEVLRDVTSARVVGTERVGWTSCKRVRFVQQGMTGDIWLGVKDNLPRRYRLTFTDLPGSPVWDIRLSKWELNPAVDERLFTQRASANSFRVQMLKSR